MEPLGLRPSRAIFAFGATRATAQRGNKHVIFPRNGSTAKKWQTLPSLPEYYLVTITLDVRDILPVLPSYIYMAFVHLYHEHPQEGSTWRSVFISLYRFSYLISYLLKLHCQSLLAITFYSSTVMINHSWQLAGATSTICKGFKNLGEQRSHGKTTCTWTGCGEAGQEEEEAVH